MILGRFQCIPPHEGHIKLIEHVLDEGKNVCIALRENDGSDKNPYSFRERKEAFLKIFNQEIIEGRLKIIEIPDITELVHGRGVGWKVTEISLSKKIELISATEKRKERKQND